MAVLARLSVPVSANTSGFARDLARATKLAESWSSTIGGKVDAALGGAARSAGPLGRVSGYLNAIGKGTGLVRLAATGADVYRSWKTVGNVFDLVRLGFTTNAAKAAALRTKIAETAGAMNVLHGATMRVRWALFKVDLGVFAAKLGVVVARAIPGLVEGLAQATWSVVRFGSGIVQAVSGVVMIVPNLYKMTSALLGVAGIGGAGLDKLRAIFAAKYVGGRIVAAVGDLTASLMRASGVSEETINRMSLLSAGRYFKGSAVAGVQKLTGAVSRLAGAANGSIDRLTSLFAANYYGRKAMAGIGELYYALKSLAAAPIGVAAGLAKASVALGRFGFQAAIIGASGLAKALWGVAGAAAAIGRTAALGGLIGLFAGAKAAGGLIGMAKSAAQLEDSMAAVRSIFGKEAGVIEAQSRKMAVALGADMKTSTDAAARLGAMFTGVGFDAKSAAQYTNTLSRLAQDFVAAFGGTTDEALGKIFSGLSGEIEPLRAYGVFMSDAAIKAQALKLGLKGVNGELTEGQKIQARAAFILDKANASVGQSIREADSAASKIAALSGRWENLKSTIGETFAPAVGAAMGDVGTILETIRTGWADNAKAASGWATGSVGGMEAVANSGGFVQRSIMGLADGWQYVKASFYTAQTYMLQGLVSIVEALQKTVSMLDWVGEKAGLGGTGFGDQLGVMVDSMRGDLDRMKTDLAAEWAKPPASQGWQKAFDEQRAKIKALQDDLAKTPMALNPGKLAEDALKGKAKKRDPFAAFASRNSKEDAAITLRTRYGGGGEKVAEKTEANTKQTAAAAKATVDVLKKVDDGLAKFLGKFGEAAGEFIF